MTPVTPFPEQGIVGYAGRRRVSCGLRLLNLSFSSADFLHNEVPGISIPEHIRNKLWKYEKVDDQLKAALEITTKLVEEIASFVDGLYIISPLNKWQISDKFVKQIRSAAWTGSGRISRLVS